MIDVFGCSSKKSVYLNMPADTLVLKIGGSLLSKSADELFAFDYFKQLKQLLGGFTGQGYKLVIIIGGGYIARRYQKDLQEHGEGDIEDIHKVGVAASSVNSEVFHALLSEHAASTVLRYAEYDDFIAGNRELDWQGKSIYIASASQPGKSNDWNALQIAMLLKVPVVFDIKNVDGVYTADPRVDPSATRIAELSWSQYLDVIGNPEQHVPGANYPIDPITARAAKQAGIKFIVCGGEDLDNLRKVLVGEADNIASVVG
jgi:uridylate kinase